MSVDVYLMDTPWVFQDRFDPITGKHGGNAPNPLLCIPPTAKRVLVGGGRTVVDMVEAIKDALGPLETLAPNQMLATLIIGSHGLPGKMFIGTGLDRYSAGAFGDLRPYFQPYHGCIRLHGCGVASDQALVADPTVCKVNPLGCKLGWRGSWSATSNSTDNGYQLLKALANVTGQPVQAAIDVQSNVFPDFFKFQGLTVYVNPDDAKTEDANTYHHDWWKIWEGEYFLKHNDFCTIEYDGKGNALTCHDQKGNAKRCQ
jgi:hypothetical protein